MTNIVHFGKYYYPDAGGIESVTISLAKGAASAGHTVAVVCFKKSPAKNKEIIDGVTVIRAPIETLIASQPLGIKYFLLCLRYAKNSEIIHLHAPNMLGALCALFISRKAQLLVHWHSDVLNKGILGKIVRPIESAMLRRANCIVATSQIYADASNTLAKYREKVTIVPLGAPDTKHTYKSTLPQQIEKKIAGKKIILSVGRLVPYKGFDVLINAAKELSTESVVVIVGSGPLQRDLQKKISTVGVEDRVILSGRLDDPALHSLFERAELFCLPSKYRTEAFGVVLLEAMAYSLPIVASDIPGSGVPWVNQHGISGLNVPVGNPLALANACNEILGSTKLRRKYSNGARLRFLSEFTEEVSVNRMMRTYGQLSPLI